MSGRPIGVAYAEINLDRDKLNKGLDSVRRDALVVTTDIEKNFKTLGIKSAEHFNLLRAQAENAYQGIKHGAKSSADDILRAEKAKNETLTRLHEQQHGKQLSLLDSVKAQWTTILPVVTAVGAGIAAIGYAATNSLGAFKDLAFQTRDLQFIAGGTSEQISGLIDVLSDYGVESSTVERAMVFLSKAVQDGSPALERLGVNIRTTSGHLKSAHTLFYEVIDALKNTKSETERNAIAQELFSRGWIAMVPIIQQGAAALKDAAKASGLTMSEDDKKRADDYRRAIEDMSDALDKMKLRFANGIIVPVTMMIRMLTPSGHTVQEGNDLLSGVMSSFDPITGGTSNRIQIPYDDPSLHSTGYKVTAPEGPTPGEQKAKAEAGKKRSERNLYLLKQDQQAAEEMQKSVTEFGVWENKELSDRMKKQETERAEYDKRDLAATEQLVTESNEFHKWEYDQAMDRLKKESEAEAYVLKQQLQGEEEWAKVMKEVGELTSKHQTDTYQQAIDSADKQRTAYREVFDSIADGLSTSIRGVQQGTQTMGEAFRNMGQTIMLSIQDMVIRRGINAIGDALLGKAGSTDTGMLGGLFSAIGSGAMSYFGGIPTLADGGIVTRPTLAVVGESGPEAVVPLSKMGGGGGTSITQVFAPQVGIPEAVRREIWAMMPAIKRETVGAVLDARGRGGAMARAMGARA